jgi:hypothetical protein
MFVFVPGMPVNVNHNTHQGLKLVNSASYMAIEVILDHSYSGHRISASKTIHCGPPAAIMRDTEIIKDVHFIEMPAGIILLTPMSVKLQCQWKRPWQQHNDSRMAGHVDPNFRSLGCLSSPLHAFIGWLTVVTTSEPLPSSRCRHCRLSWYVN